MKKILFALLAFCVILTAAACKGRFDEKTEKTSSHLIQGDDEIQTEKKDVGEKGKSGDKSEKSTVSFPKNTSRSKLTEFEKTAEDIEVYEKAHLDNAQSQSEMNAESYAVYQKWDKLLNEIYAYLKDTMTDSEFASLQKDELEWIKEKEAAIEEAASEWQGGTGEPLARNSVAIEYTKERCDYLMSLID